MEHLPRGASAAAPNEHARTTGTTTARNSTVPAPVHAPPGLPIRRFNGPLELLRDALQVFAFGDVARPGHVPMFALDSSEQRQVFDLISKAAALLDRERRARAEITTCLNRRNPAGVTTVFDDMLAQMERTNRELAGDPSALLEEPTSR